MVPCCLQYGKGKWKKIVQEGGEMFQNRTAVDLKVGGPATAALGTSVQHSCLDAVFAERL